MAVSVVRTQLGCIVGQKVRVLRDDWWSMVGACSAHKPGWSSLVMVAWACCSLAVNWCLTIGLPPFSSWPVAADFVSAAARATLAAYSAIVSFKVWWLDLSLPPPLPLSLPINILNQSEWSVSFFFFLVLINSFSGQKSKLHKNVWFI